jgi:hypothetical protein
VEVGVVALLWSRDDAERMAYFEEATKYEELV